MLSIFLILIFWGCCVWALYKPILWVIAVSVNILLISIKNLHLYFRLIYQKRLFRWNVDHPLKRRFGRWAFNSLGYTVFTGLAGTVVLFMLGSAQPLQQQIITNMIAALIISFFSIKSFHHFVKGGLSELEEEVKKFFREVAVPTK
jgi:hypothetical protein